MSSSSALADLPEELWAPLLRAVRRAVEHLDRSELPAALRPYATWKPDRLVAERPRRAVAAALAEDPRLRDLVGEALDGDSWTAAADADPRRLVAAHGPEQAAAALAARGRWDALAVVATDAADHLAARRRAGAEAAARRDEERSREARRRLDGGLAVARDERDAARRRADAAEHRLAGQTARADRLSAEVDTLRAEVERLRADAEAREREHGRRLARLRRRAERAEQRARVDDERALGVAADLDALAADLRDAVAAGHGEERGSSAPDEHGGSAALENRDPERPPATAPVVPRDVAAALPGRPAQLPGGLAEDDPKAVRALLQVPGLHLVVDGYNVTKDALGLPHGSLDEQRRWLVRHVAAVAARHAIRATVVFDGTDPRPARPPSVRGVAVVFTPGEELADDRIVEFVGADPERPFLVVSSDREVADDCRRLGANVTRSAAFLTATRA